MAAVVVGWMVDSRDEPRTLRIAAAMLLGSLLVYAAGVPLLMLSLGTDRRQALQLGVVPFVIADLLKVAAASFLTYGVLRMRR